MTVVCASLKRVDAFATQTHRKAMGLGDKSAVR